MMCLSGGEVVFLMTGLFMAFGLLVWVIWRYDR
jgi:hypothetical protein